MFGFVFFILFGMVYFFCVYLFVDFYFLLFEGYCFFYYKYEGVRVWLIGLLLILFIL